MCDTDPSDVCLRFDLRVLLHMYVDRQGPSAIGRAVQLTDIR